MAPLSSKELERQNFLNLEKKTVQECGIIVSHVLKGKNPTLAFFLSRARSMATFESHPLPSFPPTERAYQFSSPPPFLLSYPFSSHSLSFLDQVAFLLKFSLIFSHANHLTFAEVYSKSLFYERDLVH